MADESKDLAAALKRIEALEGLTSQLAASVEALEAGKPTAPKPVDVKDPLHPSKVGTSAYNELRTKLLKVLPHEKEYAAAQAQLRAAGIIG